MFYRWRRGGQIQTNLSVEAENIIHHVSQNYLTQFFVTATSKKNKDKYFYRTFLWEKQDLKTSFLGADFVWRMNSSFLSFFLSLLFSSYSLWSQKLFPDSWADFGGGEIRCAPTGIEPVHPRAQTPTLEPLGYPLPQLLPFKALVRTDNTDLNGISKTWCPVYLPHCKNFGLFTASVAIKAPPSSVVIANGRRRRCSHRQLMEEALIMCMTRSRGL